MGVWGLICEVERVVLEEPVHTRQVKFQEKFESEFHEEAVVLESQNFHTKLAGCLGSAHIFLGDKAFYPRTIFVSHPEEGSTDSV